MRIHEWVVRRGMGAAMMTRVISVIIAIRGAAANTRGSPVDTTIPYTAGSITPPTLSTAGTAAPHMHLVAVAVNGIHRVLVAVVCAFAEVGEGLRPVRVSTRPL